MLEKRLGDYLRLVAREGRGVKSGAGKTSFPNVREIYRVSCRSLASVRSRSARPASAMPLKRTAYPLPGRR